MATSFGTQPQDVLVDRAGNVLQGILLELYDTRVNATEQSSLQGAVLTNEVGLWPFQDSLNRTLMYVRDPAGRVWPVSSEGAASGAVLTGLAGLPAGSQFNVYWNGTAWTYAGSVITSRPSARADLTMVAIGGSTGPGFGEVGVDLWLRDA